MIEDIPSSAYDTIQIFSIEEISLNFYQTSWWLKCSDNCLNIHVLYIFKHNADKQGKYVKKKRDITHALRMTRKQKTYDVQIMCSKINTQVN